jgi:hypothetical protein
LAGEWHRWYSGCCNLTGVRSLVSCSAKMVTFSWENCRTMDGNLAGPNVACCSVASLPPIRVNTLQVRRLNLTTAWSLTEVAWSACTGPTVADSGVVWGFAGKSNTLLAHELSKVGCWNAHPHASACTNVRWVSIANREFQSWTLKKQKTKLVAMIEAVYTIQIVYSK